MFQQWRIDEGLRALIRDLCCSAAGLCLSGLIWNMLSGGNGACIPQGSLVLLLLIIRFCIFFCSGDSFGIPGKRTGRRILQYAVYELVSSVLFLPLAFLLWKGIPAGSLLSFPVCSFLLNTLAGEILYRVMLCRKRTRGSGCRILLVSSREKAEEIVEDLALECPDWYRSITGLVLPGGSGTGMIKDIPVVAEYGDLIDHVLFHAVDEIYFSGDLAEGDPDFSDTKETLKNMGLIVGTGCCPEQGKTRGQIIHAGSLSAEIETRNPFPLKSRILKRCMDIAGALVGMLFLGIFMIVLAPLIKFTSPGPVIFSQTRVGLNGRRFRCYKFRSMVEDSERRKEELDGENQMNGPIFKILDDPRVTKVGYFLRKTSIDEMPQFWNILKGDMSLVGTRPPTLGEFLQYRPEHKCRLSMTPGLTGMWQVSGRNDIRDFDEIIRLDMKYIDQWSLRKDIRILLKTVSVVLSGKGSH